MYGDGYFNTDPNKQNLSLDVLKQKIANIENAQKQNPEQTGQQNQTQQGENISRLQDFAKTLNADKVVWANSQTIIKEKRDTLIYNFSEWLFSQYGNQYDNHCKENNLPYVKDYVDTYVGIFANYKNPIEEQKSEIEELKKQIAQMSKKGEVL